MNNNDIYTYIPKVTLDTYFLLMESCEQISEQTEYHPEANVLVHLLQVTEIALRESEDLDLILAAMLHDIGKYKNSIDHVEIAAEMLQGHITKKTEFLINNHMRIHYLLDGEMRKLGKIYKLVHSPWLSELVLLARWDKLGRRRDYCPKFDKLQIMKQLLTVCKQHFCLQTKVGIKNKLWQG